MFFSLSTPFGVDTCEGGVNAFAVVAVLWGGILRWDGRLVTASPALVHVIEVAAGTIANEALAVGAAGGSRDGMADVTLLRGVTCLGGGLLSVALGVTGRVSLLRKWRGVVGVIGDVVVEGRHGYARFGEGAESVGA